MKSNEQLNNVVNFLLEQTVRQMRGYAQRQLDLLQTGITVDQWVLLKIIEERKQISQVELAQVSQKDTASITRILDLLQKKGLIQRIDDEYDRRKYMISLTAEGVEFVMRNQPLIDRLRDQIVHGLSQEEIQMLKSILAKIRQNLVG